MTNAEEEDRLFERSFVINFKQLSERVILAKNFMFLAVILMPFR